MCAHNHVTALDKSRTLPSAICFKAPKLPAKLLGCTNKQPGLPFLPTNLHPRVFTTLATHSHTCCSTWERSGSTTFPPNKPTDRATSFRKRQQYPKLHESSKLTLTDVRMAPRRQRERLSRSKLRRSSTQAWTLSLHRTACPTHTLLSLQRTRKRELASFWPCKLN
jgi:hypothetical protein